MGSCCSGQCYVPGAYTPDEKQAFLDRFPDRDPRICLLTKSDMEEAVNVLGGKLSRL